MYSDIGNRLGQANPLIEIGTVRARITTFYARRSGRDSCTWCECLLPGSGARPEPRWEPP